MNEQMDEIDKHIANTIAEIKEAASNHDLAAIQRIQHLSRKAAELQEMKDQVTAIQQRITMLNKEDSNATVSAPKESANASHRELPIEVTDGMIRQNLLTLTPHLKRGKVKIGEVFAIEVLPSGDRFQTELLDKGNKLRARGEIARFYKEAKVRAGDYVILGEVSPGRWTLKKAPPGKYGISLLQM